MKIGRRKLITGAAALSAFGAIKAKGAVYPSAQSNLLLKPGFPGKIRCSILYASQWPDWAYAWRNFDWNGYWKPAINASKSVGANCIKFNLGGVSPDNGISYPSDAVLKAELNQVCAYAAALGMAVYLQLGYNPIQQFGAGASGLAAGVAASAKIAGWASLIPNVIAIDCLNEWATGRAGGVVWASNAAAVADLTTLISAVRAACPNKPLTISSASVADLAPIAGIVDYQDIHYYYYNNTAGPLQGIYQNPLAAIRATPGYSGRFILGETGMPGGAQGFSNDYQRQWMSAVPSTTTANDCYGGCFWTLSDTFQVAPFGSNWGMFNQNFSVKRSWISDPFGQWPGKL